MIFFVKYLYLTPRFGCDGWNCTTDLQVMSLTRYYFSTPRQSVTVIYIWSIGLDLNQRINGFAIRAIRPLWYRCTNYRETHYPLGTVTEYDRATMCFTIVPKVEITP